MARWRLRQKHYLNVPGVDWDYKEVTNEGRQKRMTLPVPSYLDPDNPGDCNYPGEIIVAYAEGAQRRDIIFEGEPTPDMEPLDAQAEAISAALEKKWQHPIDKLGDGGYGEMLERSFEKMMIRIGAGAPTTTGPTMEQFEAMQKQIEALTQQNATLKAAAEAPARRV